MSQRTSNGQVVAAINENTQLLKGLLLALTGGNVPMAAAAAAPAPTIDPKGGIVLGSPTNTKNNANIPEPVNLVRARGGATGIRSNNHQIMPRNDAWAAAFHNPDRHIRYSSGDGTTAWVVDLIWDSNGNVTVKKEDPQGNTLVTVTGTIARSWAAAHRTQSWVNRPNVAK